MCLSNRRELARIIKLTRISKFVAFFTPESNAMENFFPPRNFSSGGFFYKQTLFRFSNVWRHHCIRGVGANELEDWQIERIGKSKGLANR